MAKSGLENIIITTAYPFIKEAAVVWVQNSILSDNYSCCREKCGLINDKGEFIIPPIYDNIKYNGGANIAVNIGFEEHESYEESGKWGVIDLNNNSDPTKIFGNLSVGEWSVCCRISKKMGSY
jgi:hypothetical protein